MPIPGYATATSYMRDLDGRASLGDTQSFRITPIRTGVNNNPELDYAKLIVMLGGALAAALLYDLIANRNRGDE